jgi:hypothetical protein
VGTGATFGPWQAPPVMDVAILGAMVMARLQCLAGMVHCRHVRRVAHLVSAAPPFPHDPRPDWLDSLGQVPRRLPPSEPSVGAPIFKIRQKLDNYLIDS